MSLCNSLHMLLDVSLEHALLVALREQPAAGLELARRFDRSIGYFWHATHQQIYRTLGRMETDGWLHAQPVSQRGRPRKVVYDVTPAGAEALAAWLAEPTATEPLRSALAVKLRGASYGDQVAVLDQARDHLADHALRLAHYAHLAERDYPEPAGLSGHALDQYLVLRGGIRVEEFWVGWLEEYLAAHDQGVT